MWTIIINNLDNGVADVNASHNSGFNYGSRIKTGELDAFVNKAKEELVKYQEDLNDINSLKSQIETLLNS